MAAERGPTMVNLLSRLHLFIALQQLIVFGYTVSTLASGGGSRNDRSGLGQGRNGISTSGGTSSFMTMWTQGQVYVLNAGQSVELDCEFYAETFNMFKNPVVWRKHQRQELTEVNIMGNILQPFLATGRFVVTFTTNPPRYRMRLRITDLSLEDSGNYSCEVRGPRANTLGSVTHYIFIRAPVQSVFFTALNTSALQPLPVFSTISTPTYRGGQHAQQLSGDTAESPQTPDGTGVGATPSNHMTELTFSAGIAGILRCVAVGGYPPPEVAVRIGADDVTERMPTVVHAASLLGEPGLRVMLHRTERSTDAMVLDAEDDGKTVTCVATVADIGSVSATAKLVVHRYFIDSLAPAIQSLYKASIARTKQICGFFNSAITDRLIDGNAPVVHCPQASAVLDDPNVFIQCEVKARPSLTSLYWQIDVNGTTVAEGTIKDEYWTLVMVRTDGVIETRLFMRRATMSSFRQYTLFAENGVGITRTDTELTRRRSPIDTYSALELYRHYNSGQHHHRSVSGSRSADSVVVFDRDGTHSNGDEYDSDLHDDDDDDGNTPDKHTGAVVPSGGGSSRLFRGGKPSSASNSLSKDLLGWPLGSIVAVVSFAVSVSGRRFRLQLDLLTYLRPGRAVDFISY